PDSMLVDFFLEVRSVGTQPHPVLSGGGSHAASRLPPVSDLAGWFFRRAGRPYHWLRWLRTCLSRTTPLLLDAQAEATRSARARAGHNRRRAARASPDSNGRGPRHP